MSIVLTESVILQVFPYGETSKILKLLTASHGVRSAIAKGARRPRSRFGGILEPFATGVATLHLRDGRELQTLTAFDIQRAHQRLGSDLLRFGGASLVAETVLRTGSEEPQPNLYHSVLHTLERIQGCEPRQLECAILAGTWALIALLGFAPDLEACLDCGRAPSPDEDVRFDPAAGGMRCPDCAAGTPGRMLPPRARAALSGLIQGYEVALEKTEGHWRLLGLFLDHHVLEGGSLRSMAFITEALESKRCAG